ncbi:tRNA (adenosine(37)-N6)-dimethylallyltransferase MiaA [Rhodothalassium salexigens]|uniref:tRNA (adenosine(37)-N6)-dimethylallyltransferase MiaA n=1 Tax=Rhodothalassium salexigens TaxID=1086 RepID=UPI0019137CC8|nr:tRNA (adenosine(37)-N6)-dimethylallyltransferase MiaA [Rhodothalassium salexigens]MBK5911000.1 tRNA (adenosine(37)-N6)-dimethylallyltransferase MiaA [Rhodothalassium salexigens]MBK5921789.1 tRNA (adenosine(37)-N6)-dimethylallyltransferase MiaA [Rhodothalassium salexigens]
MENDLGSAKGKAVLIAGPTSAGKTAVALRLARALGGWVINADSVQVYADLALLSARPSAREQGGVPHRLFGIVDAGTAFSAADWAAAAAEALAEADAAGAVPIFVGGTGLYFEALCDGLAPVPAIDPAVRSAVRDAMAARGPQALYDDLAHEDPQAAATLAPGDSQRIARALEVMRSTGRPLSAWQGARTPGPLAGRPQLRAVLSLDRARLRDRIARRFEAMMAAGALDEVRALAARDLDPSLPAMKALGVPPLLDHVRGRLDRDTAVARAITQTRQYAKRQETWFRNRLASWPRLDAGDPDAAAVALARRFAAPAQGAARPPH